MGKLSKPHDHFYKSWISDKKMAAAYLKIHLPEKLVPAFQFETMEPQNISFIDDDLSEVLSDQLYKVKINNKDAYAYFVCEHQSTCEKFMPLRIWRYVIRIMHYHIDKLKNKTLPIVIPIVLYTGKKPYNYSTDIFDLFDDKEMAKDTLLKPFQLVDLHRIPDKTLKNHALLGVIELIFKHARDKSLPELLEELMPFFHQLEDEVGESFILTMYNYTIDQSDHVDAKVLATKIAKNVSKPTGEKIMTAAQRLRQEGVTEGEVRGKVEAEQRIVIQMIEKGVEHVFIAQVTGLSIDHVRELAVSIEEKV